MSIRMPADLRDRAQDILARLHALGIDLLPCPGTKEWVRPSIAVLALRGLERELASTYDQIHSVDFPQQGYDHEMFAKAMAAKYLNEKEGIR